MPRNSLQRNAWVSSTFQPFAEGKLITGRNEVVAKVIFLHLSVILFTGGVCLNACWDTNPPLPGSRPLPGADTPSPEQTPPRSRHPTTPPFRADTPSSRHPPRADPPGSTHHPRADPPGADTTPRSRHPPQEQTPPRSRQVPPSPPPPRSRLQHTVYERPVRILLECNLVN